MMKAIVSLSGGMDSTTVLARALEDGHEVEAIGFFYGSKHNPYENKAAREIAKHYDVPFKLVHIDQAMGAMKSNLLKNGGRIPEGHYEHESMSLTVVPGRNMIFISLLAGIAWSRKAELVYVGIHSGDHAIYPDCRPQFFDAMNLATQEGTDGFVSLMAPYLNSNKTGIIAEGLELSVPYNITRTCYTDHPIACGRCGACQERQEAFLANNMEDPIPYRFRGILPKEA